MRHVRLLLTLLMVLLVGCEDNSTSNPVATPDLSTNAAAGAAAASSGSSEGGVASGQSSSAAQPQQAVKLGSFCSDNTITCIAYWDRILSEYPDLVDKLKKIKDEQDQKDRRALDANEQTEVRFYSEDGSSQTVSGSHVDIIVTDLQRGELDSLISFLAEVPEKAKQLGVSASVRLDKASTKEKGARPTVIVLGGQGSVSIKGSKGTQAQHIDLFLADKQQMIERIIVNTFGKRGESTLNRLPKGFVKSGLGARPPPNASRVVVVGALREINIEGSKDKSTQVISFQKWANKSNDSTITDDVSNIVAKALKEEEERKEKEMEVPIVPEVKIPEYKPPERRWPFSSPPPSGWRRPDEPSYGGDPEQPTYRPPPEWRPPTPEPHIYRPPVEYHAPSYRPPPVRFTPRPFR